MNLSDFDYILPERLIAQYPASDRKEARLLVLHKRTGKIEHRTFKDIVEYFHKNDLLILNDTRVVPAKLAGRKDTGGKVEALILNPLYSQLPRGEYEVLLKPARGCRPGSKIKFGDGRLVATISRIENGRRFIKFECNEDFESLLEILGQVPLPPYIKRDPLDSDKERYQTIYATKKGAVAAPTAGLHFTDEVLKSISDKGVDVAFVTLHVGYGTFKPVKCEDIVRHKIEKEYFEISGEVIEKLKDKKGRLFAVGTTTCRALETVAAGFTPLESPAIYDGDETYKVISHRKGGKAPSFLTGFTEGERRKKYPGFQIEQNIKGWTDLFIYPPYKFRLVDVLLTNFHLPRTTLLMLVSAFCGRSLLMKAYAEAIRQRYRFYSYGDAMLII